MNQISEIRLRLIRQITEEEDLNLLLAMQQLFQNAPQKSKLERQRVIKRLHKPPTLKLDVEALKKKQNFTQFNRARFDQLIQELNIQEPIEQLLKMI
jgi:hypothetical protein